MKTILSTTLALAVLVPAMNADDKKNSKTRSTKTSTRVSTVNGKTDGTVTVTIDNDGKKETKTWKIATPYTKIQEHPVMVKAQTHKKERVTWIGVAVSEVSDDLRTQLDIPEGSGVRVRQAIKDSPAAKAGIRTDDLIVRIDEQIIFTIPQFQALMRSYKSGTEVEVTYYRKGRKQKAKAKLNTHEIITQIKQPNQTSQPQTQFNLAPTTLSTLLSTPSMITQYQAHIDPNAAAWKGIQADASAAAKLAVVQSKNIQQQWPHTRQHTRAVILRPDGKTTILEGPEQIQRELRKSIEASLQDSKLSKAVLKDVLKAVDQAFKSLTKN